MVALSASVRSLAVTIRGPLGEATRLLQHLRLFDQEAQQLLHRLPRFGLGLLWIYPPALSCQPLCLVLQAFEPFSPCCSGTLAGLRALVPPRSHREVEQTFPACPAAWLDRARVLGSANLSPRAGFFVLGRRASGRALC